MSKKVELIIEIDNKGHIKVVPSGTTGPECLELMAFLDKIESFNITETIPNEDMGKNHIVKISNKINEKQ